jgi:hypothetical protein
MYIVNINQIMRLALLVSVFALVLVFNLSVRADDDVRQPDLPAACGELQVEAGNKVSFHVYALGVQIYRWNGASWSFVAPEANLYASANYKGLVGEHYAGPTWESNSGSKVVGTVQKRCTPDPTAIPWLLLQAAPTDDPGIFHNVTFIQRVDTNGGLAPAAPGAFVGEEKRVPYTAEYYFYRAED